ncbi:MAG: TetR/AcrR family transcriptional regulator [Bryobacteraceae bacterium]
MRPSRALSPTSDTPVQGDISTQERVLDKAAELFWKKGYAATTTREIAASLGIRQASLYHHVASKENLLCQLCVTSLEQLLQEVQTAVSESDWPDGKIRLLVQAHLNTLLKYRTRHALIDALSADQLAEIFARTYVEGASTSAGRVSLVLPKLRLSARNATPRRRRPARISRKAGSTLQDAAAALFAKKGYALTSTREIAEELGIQKASLYYHIETKEDLLYDICKSILKKITDDVEEALKQSSDPLQRTEILIRTHIESMLRDYERHSAALTEMSCLSRERLNEVTALRDFYESLARSVLDAAQKAGVLRADVPVKYLCLALLGLLNRVLVWFRPNGPLSPEQIGMLLARIYLTGAAADSNPKRG